MIDCVITLKKIIDKLYQQQVDVQLTRPDPKFGDFATNAALQLAKPLCKNPREIAEAIAEELRGRQEFSEVSVAGPGFINLTLSDQAVLELLKVRPATNRAGKTVVIETNCPNPFKAMHIGHALNSILADTMANLLAVDGAAVHRVSYHGDVGTHVGKSIWAILREIDSDVNKLDAIPTDKRTSTTIRMPLRSDSSFTFTRK